MTPDEPKTDERAQDRGYAPAVGSDCQRLPIGDVAGDYSDFYFKLWNGEIPMPCWLEIGCAAHKVTKDNHRDLARGMLLCLEVRGHFQ